MMVRVLVRFAFAPFILALLVGPFLPPASAAPLRVSELNSRETVLAWMLAYRAKPAPTQVPVVMRTVSRIGGFRDVDAAGVYVGFLAGVLAADPAKAEALAIKLLALPDEDQWVVVRAVAYSGLPEWKSLLTKVAARAPGRKAMVDKHLAGKLPRLEDLAFDDAGVLDKMRDGFKSMFGDRPQRLTHDPSPDLVDTLWGTYFATGGYSPVARLIAMLAWSRERDHVEKLTMGSIAKYTLALNAARDSELLALMKWARTQQPKDIVKVLDDVIDAAETADTPRLRRDALAAIEELRRKGPAWKRDVSWWGQIGQGALSLGCIGAAATGHVELGVPCVLGGALSSGVLYYLGSSR
jgi:hypothetical protein